jgi:hypothetical protein
VSTPGEWLLAQSPFTEDGLHRGTSLSSVFAEEPVSLDVFIRDSRFIGMSPLSEPQYEVLKYAERIFYPELYPLMEQEFGGYWNPIPVVNLITLLVGKGGGKDMIARLASLRVAYLLLCLRDPKQYFGMPHSESIHLLNVASTKDQARLAYFEPLTRIVKYGWFKDRCQPLKSSIEWEKGITSISGSSDSETQEGLNLILGVADEVDAFRTVEELQRHSGRSPRTPLRSAEGILRMLRSSGVSRFSRTFKNLRISYPRYYGSPIMTLYRTAKKDIQKKGEKSRHVVVGPMPSWDFNPLTAAQERVVIPESPIPVPIDLVPDFQEDPPWARAAYLCLPERTQQPPFLRVPQAVQEAQVPTTEIEVTWELVRGFWQPHITLPPDLQPAAGAVYACHADLALNRDRAGFAMAHTVSWKSYDVKSEDSEDGDTYQQRLPIIAVDTALSITADLTEDPPREIPLRLIRQIMFLLKQRGFSIASISFDGWQSLSTRQELEIAGFRAPLFSLDRSDTPYVMLRTIIEEGRIILPSSELLETELTNLVRLPETNKVDHPSGGSKDLADAVCGAVCGAVEAGGREIEQMPDDDDENLFGVVVAFDLPQGAAEVLRNMRPVG